MNDDTREAVGDESDREVAELEFLEVEKEKKRVGRPAKMSEIVPNRPERVTKKSIKLAKRLSADQGMEILDILLQKSIPPEKIEAVLLELLGANDTKRGSEGSLYETPNWQARIAGLDQALKMKRFIKPGEGQASSQPIVKITFNVIDRVSQITPVEAISSDENPL